MYPIRATDDAPRFPQPLTPIGFRIFVTPRVIGMLERVMGCFCLNITLPEYFELDVLSMDYFFFSFQRFGK